MLRALQDMLNLKYVKISCITVSFPLAFDLPNTTGTFQVPERRFLALP